MWSRPRAKRGRSGGLARALPRALRPQAHRRLRGQPTVTPAPQGVRVRSGRRANDVERASAPLLRGSRECGFVSLRIGDPTSRVTSCLGFACVATLRIEGCLNRTL